ncbi:PTS sugar transporter subunit IIA [Ignavigranum ruoffiae]|uniref:PTS sugar transporter subunit IIA n=1 Tax=Ignavigranum ruoffiae TaxID=89093 RepID=UPI0024AD90C6|nr:PTS sugar transporter subunit IIA [Ignavigranum ruoffiae]
MLGLIITGHGEFAPGMEEAVTMIAGQQNNLSSVAFRESMNLDDFQARLQRTIDEQLAESEGVIIFTDLKGGTPFNTAALLIDKQDKVKIMAGTNLPMLIEATLMAGVLTDPEQLARQLAQTGRENVEFVDFEALAEDPSEDEMDGI